MPKCTCHRQGEKRLEKTFCKSTAICTLFCEEKDRKCTFSLFIPSGSLSSLGKRNQNPIVSTTFKAQSDHAIPPTDIYNFIK